MLETLAGSSELRRNDAQKKLQTTKLVDSNFDMKTTSRRIATSHKWNNKNSGHATSKSNNRTRTTRTKKYKARQQQQNMTRTQQRQRVRPCSDERIAMEQYERPTPKYKRHSGFLSRQDISIANYNRQWPTNERKHEMQLDSNMHTTV